MRAIKEELARELSETLGTEVGISDIETPEEEHGDMAYPAMKAASKLGKPPGEVAEKASKSIKDLEIVESVSIAGPGFVNIRFKKEEYAKKVLETLKSKNMGVQDRSGKVLLEFSSPNLAKPMHVGHLRNNCLGDSLQQIMRFAGYNVTSENYIGDWGTQYGKLIYAFKKHGDEQKFEKNPMEHMYDLYVRFHEEAEEDTDLEEKGREWAKKIEDGDREARALWEKFREASIKHHKKDYRRMDIEFDRWTGESTVVEESRELVERKIEENKLTTDNDGSVFIELEDHNLPGTVLLKEDGSTLYMTRDLYNIEKRAEEGYDHNLYVVGSEQELHFKQLFATAEELGVESKGPEHISYGLLSLPEGSMSSRAGRIVSLEDAMDEAVERAEQMAEEKIERNLENAEEIGIGALKYANLSVSRKKNIEFSWDRALSFKGDSGPYLQYSGVRAISIMENASARPELKGSLDDEEHQLVKKLSLFPETLEKTVESRDPAVLANYLSKLCEQFNSFYHSKPVIDAEPEDTARRLAIVETFERVNSRGLELLGIEPLEKM